jgi:hypothetical protein
MNIPKLTASQKHAIYVILTSVSGPIINLLARRYHLGQEDIQDWLNILTGVTLSVGVVWGVAGGTPERVGDRISQFTEDDQQTVLGKMSSGAKVTAVENIPEVATVVLKDDVQNNELQKIAVSTSHPNIVTETQNEADAKKGTNG